MTEHIALIFGLAFFLGMYALGDGIGDFGKGIGNGIAEGMKAMAEAWKEINLHEKEDDQ